MSLLSELFGAFSSAKQKVLLLPDIELNYIGLKGEAFLVHSATSAVECEVERVSRR